MLEIVSCVGHEFVLLNSTGMTRLLLPFAVLAGTGTSGWRGSVEDHDLWRSCVRERHTVRTDCGTGTCLYISLLFGPGGVQFWPILCLQFWRTAHFVCMPSL